MCCFLNDLGFADKLDNNHLEKLIEIRQIMKREVEDYNKHETMYALSIIDGLSLVDETYELNRRLKNNIRSWSVIFYLVTFENLVGWWVC